MTVSASKPARRASGEHDLQLQLEHLRAENARLREENRRLKAALDAHVARAQATCLFGPVELTAGTAVVPHRS